MTTATEHDSVARERIRSRTLAEEVFALAESECAVSLGTPEFVTRFWSQLAAKIAEKTSPSHGETAPKSGRPAKMTDAESKAFEKRRCTFGMYGDHLFSDIPLEYLCWLADQPDIKDELRRYLASDRIAAELAQSGGDDD